jgi:cyclopropane-fatty-acyl-phospholipid synthase
MNTSELSNNSKTDYPMASTFCMSKMLFSHLERWNFSIRLWTMPASSETTRFTFVLNHPGGLRSVFHPPIELSIGEAFIYGDFDIEGGIHAVITLIEKINKITFTTRDLSALLQQIARLPWTHADIYISA